MVLNITKEEFFQMKQVLMDEDYEEALRIIKAFHKRLEQQKHQGMKSHLD